MDIGLVDLSDRCWIEVKGVDSRKFLNGVLTNNIQTLQGKTGCYACICTPKGKMIADLFCYACDDYFGIDCSLKLKPTILETLKKYIIFQKVELKDQSEKWRVVGVVGSKVHELFPVLKEFEHTQLDWKGFNLWVIYKMLWGFPSFELWVERQRLPELKLELNVPELDQETQETLRIESATPLFGVDMDENTIPQEANLYNALSFTKGCYVGQEIIARLEHRGHVGKKLLQLKIEGDIKPSVGEKIFSEKGEEIGVVTSSCNSSKFKSPIVLGYIRYAFLNEPQFKIGRQAAKPIPK